MMYSLKRHMACLITSLYRSHHYQMGLNCLYCNDDICCMLTYLILYNAIEYGTTREGLPSGRIIVFTLGRSRFQTESGTTEQKGPLSIYCKPTKVLPGRLFCIECQHMLKVAVISCHLTYNIFGMFSC